MTGPVEACGGAEGGTVVGAGATGAAEGATGGGAGRVSTSGAAGGKMGWGSGRDAGAEAVVPPGLGPDNGAGPAQAQSARVATHSSQGA